MEERNDTSSNRKKNIDERTHFKILSNPMVATEGTKRKMVHLIASSECQDLAGDEMLPSALDDIVNKMGPKSSVFLNHSYSIPEDLFGGLAKSPDKLYLPAGGPGLLRPDRPFAAVGMDVNVSGRSRAQKVYQDILDDIALIGSSIGFEIKDFEIKKDDSGIPFGFRIAHIDPLEQSIVGIPCNQQAWVTGGGEYMDVKSVTFEGIQKGVARFLPPEFETTDRNWPAAAAKGIFKMFGVKAKWSDDVEFAYVRKHFNDFDEVTSIYLQRLNTVLKRWGLCVANLPQAD